MKKEKDNADLNELKGRVYKGKLHDVKDAGSLTGKLVQRIGPNDPPKGYGSYGKIPHFMYINSVAKITKDIWQLNVKDPRDRWVSKWVFLDNNVHKVNLLTGRMGVTLTEELMAYQMENLGATINYCGGTIGCDPEIFVVDKQDQVIPAWEFLPDKKNPVYAGAWHRKGENALYWDGFQAEYTTKEYTCLGHESDCIQSGLWGILNEARKKFPDAKLSHLAVLPVNPKTLAEAEDKHVEFGCMPSKNVYGLAGMIAAGRDTPARFAGGHLHFGIAPFIKKPEAEARVVKSLDKILGVASVALFAGYENPMRRQYYGLPGEYRTPPHGLEYRVLPNAWLIHPVIMNVTFELARKVIGYGLQQFDHWSSPEEEVIEVIRNSDVEMAKSILKRNESVFKGLFSWSVFKGWTDELFKLFYEGMGEHLQEPHDIGKNWGLDLKQNYWTLHCEGPGMNWTKARQLIRDGQKLPVFKSNGPA